jgi:uncharacterized protein YlxP (DUF503 family)
MGASCTQVYARDVVFVKEAVESCLAARFAPIPLKAGDSLLVQSAAENEKDWLVEDPLIRLALDRGIHVVRAIAGKGASQRGRYVLSFRLIDLALNSFPEHRGILRRAMTTRQVKFDAFLSLTDGSQHVIWTAWAHLGHAEVVPSRYDARLENSDFLKRNVMESQSKLMELLVVSGVVSSLVYLLF